MSDIELRDSIAKEVFMLGAKDTLGSDDEITKETFSDLAKGAFNIADVFMNEKLTRAMQRNPIGGV